ncbi:hypothetical protein CRUP_000192 [Coryphaenoides rupestris]|nr:hypothetical protein CRUP_000192 [Coryphaenoides rupestris]
MGVVYVERTLALIKPDAVHLAEEIEAVIVKSGFTVLQRRRLHLSPEQCADLYTEHHGRQLFPSLTVFMTSGPVVALELAHGHDAVSRWKAMVGPASNARATHPQCLRAQYGTCDLRNALHASESLSAAQRELKYIFPNSLCEPIPQAKAAREYLEKCVNPTLLTGLTELCKQKPLNPSAWLSDWLMTNNPNKGRIDHAAVVQEEE